ncbi:response regulator transcription factor [Microcoleus sp. Pol11C1]|uniref:response regulator transcription factor n=1 Tax=unclassified Microcoleus TaxID=2642155 RepID=UPI002FD355FA
MLRKLRTCNSNLPVLMLTAKDLVENKVAGLDAGADNYLVKLFGMAELLTKFGALQRRSPQIHSYKLQVENLVVNCGNRTVCHFAISSKSQIIALINKEFLLSEYFIKHPNQIVNTDLIWNQLLKVSANTFSNVVAAQVRLLRRKLESVGGANLIETLQGVIYRMRN